MNPRVRRNHLKVKRMRAARDSLQRAYDRSAKTVSDMADCHYKLRLENEQLRKALEPLAKAADVFDDSLDDPEQTFLWGHSNVEKRVSVADARRARAAVRKEGNDE